MISCRLLVVLGVAILFAACGRTPTPLDTPASKAESSPEQLLPHTPTDTLPTGVPIPVTLTRIPDDSVPPLTKTTMRGVKSPARLFPEEKKLIRSKVMPVPNDLPTFVPGKDGVPLPQTIELHGKVIPARQPKPVPALPPEMRDNATADIRYLDIEHGLGYSFITDMLEDSKGHLWFATRGGLSRYDGRSFQNFTTEEGLPGFELHSLLEDSRGHLWIGMQGG